MKRGGIHETHSDLWGTEDAYFVLVTDLDDFRPNFCRSCDDDTGDSFFADHLDAIFEGFGV